MARTNTTTGGGGGVESLNALTGAVTLSAGQNVSLGEVGNNIEINANFTQTGKYMISGGATWSGTGLVYDVSFLNYFFDGLKTANASQVTLAASDPTNNRIDAIVVDEAGIVSVITGDAAASPVEPPIPEDQLQVQFILVSAGSLTPTITSEEIYMDDPTTNWTFSTYTTGAATGSINFAGTNSPKQGTECIEASTDARLGARFVRGTSFDAFQYTMLQVWVRFTGTAVASNKSLNVRFENSAGTLVANTVNLFNYGLQRGVLNTWQLVVVPITAFGALPATVKGLKMIMGGGTVGQVRQWDIDYMILTNGSVPQANVPTIVFAKDGTNIASQPGINLIEGTGITISGVNNPTNNRVDYTINASGGGTPAGSDTQIQYNNAGAFGASSDFTWDNSTKSFTAGILSGTGDLKMSIDNGTGIQYIKSNRNSFTGISFTGSGLNDLSLSGTFAGTYPTTYTVTIDGVNIQSIPYISLTGGTFSIGNSVTNGAGATGTILSDNGSTDMVVQMITGAFGNGDTIDNGLGVTATAFKPPSPADTFSWTDGTTSGSNISLDTAPISLSNGLNISFGAISGHTLSENWSWSYINTDYVVQDFDTSTGQYRIGQKDAPGTTEAYITSNFETGLTEIVGLEVNIVGTNIHITNQDVMGIKLPGDRTVSIGDIDDASSGTKIVIDDAGQQISNLIGSTQYLYLGASEARLGSANGMSGYGIIADIGSGRVNSYVDETTGFFGIYGVPSYNNYFLIRPSTGTYRIGDIDSIGNGTKIVIDDVTELVTISNVPAYADDSAATTAGLTTGQLYKTTTSGSTFLKIVP